MPLRAIERRQPVRARAKQPCGEPAGFRQQTGPHQAVDENQPEPDGSHGRVGLPGRIESPRHVMPETIDLSRGGAGSGERRMRRRAVIR